MNETFRTLVLAVGDGNTASKLAGCTNTRFRLSAGLLFEIPAVAVAKQRPDG